MRIATLVKWSFLVSLFMSITGAYLKITHAPGADILLSAGLIATLVFIISAISEVFSSQRITHNEKIMWTIAFIFFNGIAGLVYFLIGRRRVA